MVTYYHKVQEDLFMLDDQTENPRVRNFARAAVTTAIQSHIENEIFLVLIAPYASHVDAMHLALGDREQAKTLLDSAILTITCDRFYFSGADRNFAPVYLTKYFSEPREGFSAA